MTQSSIDRIVASIREEFRQKIDRRFLTDEHCV